MIGLVITARNRAELTHGLIESLNQINQGYLLLETPLIVFVDDHSTDEDAIAVFDLLEINNCYLVKIRNEKNLGIKESLKIGIDTCLQYGVGTIMNLDNDTLVKPEFMIRLWNLHKRFPNAVVTGFNTLSHDLGTGKPRHPVLEEHEDYVKKKSIGGINMAFSKETYLNHIRPCLDMKGHWDWNVCQRGLEFYCTRPSVIQHTGIKDGMNMNNPDIAHDY